MKEEQEDVEVVHNEGEHRFEAEVDGLLAVAEYVLDDDAIIFTHTEVPPEIDGSGIGNLLARAALDHARDQGLRVVPMCWFIAGYIRRNPEYQSLVRE